MPKYPKENDMGNCFTSLVEVQTTHFINANNCPWKQVGAAPLAQPDKEAVTWPRPHIVRQLPSLTWPSVSPVYAHLRNYFLIGLNDLIFSPFLFLR